MISRIIGFIVKSFRYKLCYKLIAYLSLGLLSHRELNQLIKRCLSRFRCWTGKIKAKVFRSALAPPAGCESRIFKSICVCVGFLPPERHPSSEQRGLWVKLFHMIDYRLHILSISSTEGKRSLRKTERNKERIPPHCESVELSDMYKYSEVSRGLCLFSRAP